MSRKKPPKDRLSAKDVELWKQMTDDVERVDGADYADVLDYEPDNAPVLDGGWLPETRPQGGVFKAAPQGLPKSAQGLDGRTEKRLKKGQIRPEATLDLHGMGQGQAYETLCGFVGSCSARGLRCVLVVTGKGKTGLLSDAVDWFSPKRGVLKARVPEWLSEAGLRAYVAYYTEAQPRDGGSGALYVYLRKNSV